MTISGSTFTGNQALGGNGANDLTFRDGGEALGGAIINSAPLTITNSTFTDNLAQGGDGGDNSSDGIDGGGFVGIATGGGVCNFFSSLTVTSSAFTDNQAVGGDSAVGPGGDAAGGGILGAGFGQQHPHRRDVRRQRGDRRQRRPGFGGRQRVRRRLLRRHLSTATVSHALFLDNLAQGGAGGSGATGGVGAGGAVANGGGFGELVVAAIGAGPDNSSLTLDHSTLLLNVAQGGVGGVGGDGGNGLGGGAYNDAATTLALTKDLVTLNRADGGHGRHGGADGDGIGGGFYSMGTYTDLFTLIVGNDASTSGDNIGP